MIGRERQVGERGRRPGAAGVAAAPAPRPTPPDFMLIGAPKAGTTSLHAYLRRHPAVFMCEPKEPEFFSRAQVWERGAAWYAELFSEAPAWALRGEASTTYSRWPHTEDAPRLIAEHSRVDRFIYIMRHPVERAYSHYCHHMRTGVTKTFEQALRDDSIYFDCGNYMAQIERYLRFFDRGCFLFLFSEQLERDPAGVLDRVQDFLGLRRHDLFAGAGLRENAGSGDYYVRHWWKERLGRIAGASAAIERLPPAWRRRGFRALKGSPLGRRVSRQHRIAPLSPETRRKLAARYAAPNARLAAFLEVDLRHWSL